MTRINVGMMPSELVGKHLLAEHREIKRIPNCIQKGRFNLKNVPNEFTLGKGHVSFFYDKLEYLRKRYQALYEECINRGYKVEYYGDAWDGLPPELMNDYTSTQRDREIIQERINEKLNK